MCDQPIGPKLVTLLPPGAANSNEMKAAAFFDVPQPKISKIIGGKVSGFSIEYLVKMAAKAGKTPRISFVRKQAA